jgi:hypothetical protein
MKLEIGKRYIVTKASDDGTFDVGDHIYLHEDGSIICKEAEGWIDSMQVEYATKGMIFEIDQTWLSKRRRELLDELEELNALNK